MAKQVKATQLISDVDKLAKQFADLYTQIKKNTDLLAQTQQAFNKTSKSQGEVASKTNAVKKALTEVEKIQIRSNKITLESVKATEALKDKRKALTDQVKKDNGTLKKSNSLFRSMKKAMLSAVVTMLTFRAAFNVIKNGFKTIIQFEKGMSAVRAITGATAKEFKTLQENALLLGRTTSKTALQVAQLQVEFAKLGFSTAEILSATEATINLSIAAGTDLANAAVVAASTVRGFGLSASQTTRVVDVMAKSFSSSALDLEKFKTAMAIVAPIAKSAGKSIEFATSRIAILADAGIDASTAGTSLRNIFLELNKQGLTWEEGLEKINTSTNKNVTALELFGKRGATAALVLADNIDKAEGLEVALNGAAGAAKEMADIMEDNLAGDINKAKSAWEGFILGLNDGTGALSKAGRAVIKFGTNAIRSLNTLDLWFKSEKRFTSGDFDRLLENMDFVKTESGKRVGEIIDNFEELNKGVSTEELVKDWSTFRKLFKDQDEDIKSIQGLWEAYGRQKQELIETEKQAEIDSANAKIKAEEEAVRVKAALAEKEIEDIIKANEKINEKIFALTASETEIKLRAIEKQAAAYRKAGASEIKIAEFVAIAKEKIGDDLVNILIKKEEKRLADQLKLEEDDINREIEADIALNDAETERLIQQINDEYELKKAAAEKEIELEKEKQARIGQIKEAAIEAAGQIVSDRLTAGIDEDLDRIQAAANAEQEILNDKLDKGLITEAEFKKKSKAIDLKSKQDAAKAEKKKALYDIAINTIVAVAKTFATLGWPAGIAGAAVMAAIGGIQASVVASRPLPKFEKGEVNIKGRRHSEGGINAEIERGESVINRDGTANAPNLLEGINKGFIKDIDLLPSYTKIHGADTHELAEKHSININLESVVASNNRIEKAIINQPRNITNITPTTFERSYQVGMKKTKFEDDWIRK